MKEKIITIDVVSDVACPWCYVGKRRLESAIKQWKGAAIEVKWHPYQLDPTIRPEGFTRDEYLTNKFGSIENVQEMINRLTQAGESLGIKFDFGEKWLAVNTLHLHQLINVAQEEGFGVKLKERFLAAYFERAQHLNNPEVLYEITKEFGWDNEKVNSIVQDQGIAKKVKAEIDYYKQRGVSSVPFFVINGEFGINGAQPAEAFLQAFQSVSPLDVISEGESCDPVTKNC